MNMFTCVRAHTPTNITHTHTHTPLVYVSQSKFSFGFWERKQFPMCFVSKLGWVEQTQRTPAVRTLSPCLPLVMLPHEAIRPTPGRKRSFQSPSHGVDTATFWPQGLKSKVLCATFIAGTTGKHTEGKIGLAVPRLLLDHHLAPVLRVKC